MMVEINRRRRSDSGRSVAVPDDCFVTLHPNAVVWVAGEKDFFQ